MRKIVLSCCLLMLTSFLTAQQQKKEIYNDFSRWSLGVNGGISIFRGDMVSFSADKTYIGGTRRFATRLPVYPDFRFVIDGRHGAGERECQGVGERVQDLPERRVLLWHEARGGFCLLQRPLREGEIFHARVTRGF